MTEKDYLRRGLERYSPRRTSVRGDQEITCLHQRERGSQGPRLRGIIGLGQRQIEAVAGGILHFAKFFDGLGGTLFPVTSAPEQDHWNVQFLDDPADSRGRIGIQF